MVIEKRIGGRFGLLTACFAATFQVAHAEKLAIGETNAAGEYRPNLASTNVNEVAPDLKLNSSGRATLSNAKWVVYDEDLDIFNAREDVTRLTVEKTGTLIFDNTTKGTTTENIFWDSPGTFIKRGPSRMVVRGKNYRWRSKVYIQEGTWEQVVPYTIAANSTNYVYISDGATLHLNDDSSFSGAEIHVQGTGVNGGGAIIIDDFATAAMTKLVLEGDTLVTANADGRILGGYTATSGAAGKINPAELTLNGHTLTIGGTSASISFYNLRTFGEEGGDIVVNSRDKPFTLNLYCGLTDEFENYDLSHVDSITLPADTTVTVAGAIATAISPDFNFMGNAMLTVYADRGDVDARNLTGTIKIPEGKTLNILPFRTTGSKGSYAFNLRGPITGGGNVTFGTSDDLANGSVYLWSTNGYTGATTVYGQSNFKVYACTSNAIPTSSAVVVNGGQILPALAREAETGAPTWDGVTLLAAHQRLGATKFAPYVGLVDDATSVTVTPAQVAAAYPDGLSFGATGEGLGGYSLVGPYTAAAPLDLAWSNGTLRLTGPETITLGSAQVAPGAQPIDTPSTLVLDSADVVFGEDGLNIGSRRTDSDLDVGYARVVITNATLASSVATVSDKDLFEGTLFVGRNARGILEVEAGTVISNRLIVGGGTSNTRGAGYGAVYQRGGTVITRALNKSGTLSYSSNVGSTGEGYYELLGGAFKTIGYFGVGSYYHGTFLQLGGTATFGGALHLAYANGGYGHFTVLGGTTKCLSTIYLTGGTSGEGFLTVSGAASHFDASEASNSRVVVNNKADNPLRTTINVNEEGVLTTTGFYGPSLSTLENPFIINFNGGVLRHCGSNKSIFTYSQSKTTPRVFIYEKGIVFDSNETDITTAAAVLEAQKTGGIQSITLAEPIENCIVAPEVFISGDGFGASAIALLDSRTHMVTNILVTSHGWGYTAANTTVSLRYAKSAVSSYAGLATPVFGDNDIGGLTKMGDGTMTVANTNAWEKWTKVLGGTLKVACDQAIPNGTALTLSNGATLDFNDKEEPTFTGLDGTGGTAANGAIKVTGPMTVSAKAFVAQASCAVTGTVDLTGVTSLTLTDAELLTEEMKDRRGLNLISATELLLPDGGLTVQGVPEGWKATASGNRIRLGPVKGFVMFVR